MKRRHIRPAVVAVHWKRVEQSLADWLGGVGVLDRRAVATLPEFYGKGTECVEVEFETLQY